MGGSKIEARAILQTFFEIYEPLKSERLTIKRDVFGDCYLIEYQCPVSIGLIDVLWWTPLNDIMLLSRR
jgi:hypothetical protein